MTTAPNQAVPSGLHGAGNLRSICGTWAEQRRKPNSSFDCNCAPHHRRRRPAKRRRTCQTMVDPGCAVCTSLMTVIVGNTSLNVALPTLSGTLGASTSQLQWIVDGYSLVFARHGVRVGCYPHLSPPWAWSKEQKGYQ